MAMKLGRRVYLSGPMTGLEDYNRTAFAEAAQHLRAQGHEVHNPGEEDAHQGLVDGVATHRDYMRHDLPAVIASDAVVVLPGWERSRGARLEVHTALVCDIPVTRYRTGERVTAIAEDHPPRPARVSPTPPREPVGVASGGIVTNPRVALVNDNPPPPPWAVSRRPGVPRGDVTGPAGGNGTPSPGATRVTDPETGGQKDAKPAKFSQLPWGALRIVAEVYGHGAQKYAAHNYRKGYAWSLSIDALGRHLAAFIDGEDMDSESGYPHMAHVAWHALALLTFMVEHPDKDDRYKRQARDVFGVGR